MESVVPVLVLGIPRATDTGKVSLRKEFSYRIIGGSIIKKVELSYNTGRIQKMGCHRRSPPRGYQAFLIRSTGWADELVSPGSPS